MRTTKKNWVFIVATVGVGTQAASVDIHDNFSDERQFTSPPPDKRAKHFSDERQFTSPPPDNRAKHWFGHHRSLMAEGAEQAFGQSLEAEQSLPLGSNSTINSETPQSKQTESWTERVLVKFVESSKKYNVPEEAVRGVWECPKDSKVHFIGDMHGDVQAAMQLLETLGVVDIDTRGVDTGLHWKWIGTWKTGVKDCVLSTGDISDRGDEFLELMKLYQKLEAEAAAEGGMFGFVLGNHEVARQLGVPRAEAGTKERTLDDIKSFGGIDKRVKALDPNGEGPGRWLFAHAVVGFEKRTGTVFAHAGPTGTWLKTFTEGFSRITGDDLCGPSTSSPSDQIRIDCTIKTVQAVNAMAATLIHNDNNGIAILGESDGYEACMKGLLTCQMQAHDASTMEQFLIDPAMSPLCSQGGPMWTRVYVLSSKYTPGNALKELDGAFGYLPAMQRMVVGHSIQKFNLASRTKLFKVLLGYKHFGAGYKQLSKSQDGEAPLAKSKFGLVTPYKRMATNDLIQEVADDVDTEEFDDGAKDLLTRQSWYPKFLMVPCTLEEISSGRCYADLFGIDAADSSAYHKRDPDYYVSALTLLKDESSGRVKWFIAQKQVKSRFYTGSSKVVKSTKLKGKLPSKPWWFGRSLHHGLTTPPNKSSDLKIVKKVLLQNFKHKEVPRRRGHAKLVRRNGVIYPRRVDFDDI